ncbi:NAD(P)/FAD-dependent oxidoreductase [Bacillus sp. Bva_UNVM-123]|uniref:flavin-containing monooxygenase n=1 Tax=Bacillus sp. Bva_UNVM-123 TaxID=2829798 RepID=UPI00391F6077
METIFDSIVIGAGQAGLATAYYLKNKGLQYLVLDESEQTAGSWPNYYDSLTLFSPVKYSSLPGLKFPGGSNHYPTKVEVINYLTDYAKQFELNIKTETKVIDVLKNNNLFLVKTVNGSVYKAKTIISATGSFSSPYIPNINGMELFNGHIIHSSQYKNSKEFKDQRVIVVGAGNSAIQIAYELAGKSKVTLATRNLIKFIPQTLLGKDIHYWFNLSGLDYYPFAKSLSLTNSVLDTGIYKKAILRNKPDRRQMFTSITKDGVLWINGEEKVNSIIFATGYRPKVMYLKSLNGAIDEQGLPIHDKGISKSIKGLFYIGLSGQRSFSSATLRGVGKDAKFIVNKVNAILANI